MIVYWVTLHLDNGMLDTYAFSKKIEAEKFAARYTAEVVEDEAYETAEEAFLDRMHSEEMFGFTPEPTN